MGRVLVITVISPAHVNGVGLASKTCPKTTCGDLKVTTEDIISTGINNVYGWRFGDDKIWNSNQKIFYTYD